MTPILRIERPGKWYQVVAPMLILALVGLGCDARGATTSTGQIVFSSNRSGAWRLWTIQAYGSGLQQITRQEGDESDVDPMFSPDGKSILFTSTRGGKAGVWRITVDRSTPERLCDGDDLAVHELPDRPDDLLLDVGEPFGPRQPRHRHSLVAKVSGKYAGRP
jgi:hypothetical protein